MTRFRFLAVPVLLTGLLSPSPPSAEARNQEDTPSVQTMIDQAVVGLLRRQHRVGAYRIWEYWEGDLDSRVLWRIVASTALCAEALLAAPGFDSDPDRRDAVAGATRYLVDHNGPNAGEWSNLFVLRFLLRLETLGRVPDGLGSLVSGTIDAAAEYLGDELLPRPDKEPGIAFYGDILNRGIAPQASFLTAPALISLLQAHHRGRRVCLEAVGRSLEALESARQSTGAFRYIGTGPITPADGEREAGKSTVQGAAARSPLCEAALYGWGRSGRDRLTWAVGNFFDHWDLMRDNVFPNGVARAGWPEPHDPDCFFIAPYYILRGLQGTALAVEELGGFGTIVRRAQLVLKLREIRRPDGMWLDWGIGKDPSAATAMAILALTAPGNTPARLTSVPVAVFLRGDANGDGIVDISDSTKILTKLYLDGSVRICPMDAADVNDSGDVDISDAIRLLNFLFLGGPAPAAPFPEPGPDVTEDDLHH